MNWVEHNSTMSSIRGDNCSGLTADIGAAALVYDEGHLANSVCGCCDRKMYFYQNILLKKVCMPCVAVVRAAMSGISRADCGESIP